MYFCFEQIIKLDTLTDFQLKKELCLWLYFEKHFLEFTIIRKFIF